MELVNKLGICSTFLTLILLSKKRSIAFRDYLNIVAYNSKYYDEVKSLLADAFYNDMTYSWGRALGRTIDFFKARMDEYLPTLVNSPVSSHVGLNQHGEVIGVLTLDPFPDDKKVSEEEKRTDPVKAIMAEAKNRFWKNFKKRKGLDVTNAGRGCYFALLGVDKNARRKRIGTRLVSHAVDYSKTKLGSQYCLGFCTSPKSTVVFSLAGFEKWDEIEYGTFQLPVDGSRPFQKIPGGLSIMVKVLS